MTANRISEIFGVRLTKKLRGKLSAVVEQIEHGHHVFRVNFKNALLRQYEKFSRFLRNELLSNNLYDFGLKKGALRENSENWAIGGEFGVVPFQSFRS